MPMLPTLCITGKLVYKSEVKHEKSGLNLVGVTSALVFEQDKLLGKQYWLLQRYTPFKV